MRRLLPLAAASALLVVLGACSSPASTASGGGAPSASAAASEPAGAPAESAAPSASSGTGGSGGGAAVTIKDFAFGPPTLTVAAGTAVTWTNQDAAGHTVTFDSGGVTSERLSTGATYSHTFASAGTFSYHCAIHTSMKGVITVTQ